MKKTKYYYLLLILLLVVSVSSCKNEHIHDYDVEEIDATCEQIGSINYTCKECGDSFTEEIPPLGHDMVDADLTHKQHCKVCNKEFGKSFLEEELVLPATTDTRLFLPSKIYSYDVTWESLDRDVMLDDGIIIASNTSKTGKLRATIHLENDATYKIDYEIEVLPVSIFDGQYNSVYEYYNSKLSRPISKNVSLIKDTYGGYDVRYESADQNIITSNGVITQTIKVQEVIMYVYVIKDGIAKKFASVVTINDYNAKQRVTLATTKINEIIAKFENGETDNLYTYDEEYEVSVTWSSNILEFFVLNNKVITPLNKTDIHLTCTLKYESEKSSASKDLSFYLKNVGGKINEEDFMNALVEYVNDFEIKGSINHLHKEYNDELFLDYQERINSYGVLNLATGKSPFINREHIIDIKRNDFKHKFFGSRGFGATKPNVSASDLAKKFYNGYTMPNDQNILWVTVHESAMTVNGQNAEYLAKMQYRTAFVSEDPREASWTYQIDAYSIYQSFEDNVICWHAGDGTASKMTGNTNGIGIEMCVNQDGNYEGTITNNAKLVAYLMLRYNLTLDNVKRHYDFSGKECPSYMIRTSRWEEFKEMVQKEYLMQKYYKDAKVEYSLSTDKYDSTQKVLSNLFIVGDNELYYNLPTDNNIDINYKVTVQRNDKTYTFEKVITLKPDKE